MKTTRQQSESRSQLKNESGSTYSSKRVRSLYFSLLSLCFVLSALLVFILIPPLAVADEKAEDPPEVTVEVFADFQCPYCAQFAKTVRQLQSNGVEGVKTNVVFKNFPLSFHPDAQLAAQAAMAAREQGKFWEMHDLLYANQAALKREDLLRTATKLGLDMDRFSKDLDSDRVKQIVVADFFEGMKLGVQGTPTFFINGKSYSGAMPYEKVKQLVVDEFGKKRAIAEIPDTLLSEGPAGAPLTIEFFADLESPISQSAKRVLDQIIAQHPSEVRVQFRNFPLSFHPLAGMAHGAAMAAARDGHFWEFVTYILDHQETLREQDLIAYAGMLGMDKTKFAETIEQRRYAPRVDADLAQGFQRGVRGSPVIFVNNRRIDGVPSIQTLTDYVRAELSAKGAK